MLHKAMLSNAYFDVSQTAIVACYNLHQLKCHSKWYHLSIHYPYRKQYANIEKAKVISKKHKYNSDHTIV